MKSFAVAVLLVVTITIAQVAGDCWETSDCQQDSAQVKGCAQYGRVEQSRRACPGGNYYTCCTSNATTTTGGSTAGVTTRYWDCCKPSCAWSANVNAAAPVQTCAKDGVSILDVNTQSACNGGSAYVCNNQQPFVVNDVGYGFAAAAFSGQGLPQYCCTCYNLTFTSGPITGKHMIVQVTNTGSDVGGTQFDIMIPGGGVGIYNGCQSQWGAPSTGWGAQYGGVSSDSDCSTLPTQLQAGCHFRFGWYQNSNNPSVSFQQVTCPSVLTSKSGCTHK